ncbi:M56 family metallopeptidase [Clostridiaceae bacterium M8S5]|nr:M56 family metallopeptidase [Clostridiaceae bacterium M8S5]
MDFISACFTNILSVSFTSSIVALAILMLRQIAKKKLNIRYIYLLIVLAILRFCLIIVPESPISILSIIPNYDKIEKAIPDGMVIAHNYEKTHTNQNSTENNIQKNYNKNATISLDRDIHKDKPKTSLEIREILAMIWIGGVILMVLATIILQLRVRLQLYNSKMLSDARLMDIVEECKDSLGIKRHVRVFIGDKFNSPCITGIFKPCIYYPCSLIDIDVDSLKNIILHELSHFKRRDLITNNIVLLAVSLHWFNPIMWILMMVYRMDVELACDSYVLNRLGEKNAVSYGSTILQVAKLNLDNTRRIGVVCYFSSSAKQLERRIRLIKKYKSKSIKVTAVVLLGSIIIGSAILTNPVSVEGASKAVKISQGKSAISQENVLTKRDSLRYNNLEKLYEDTEYKLIPSCFSKDYIDVSSGTFGSVLIKDGEAILSMEDNRNKNSRWFNLLMSRVNPMDIKGIGEIISSEPMTVGELKGQKIVCNANDDEVSEYFVYKIQDEYYGVNYKNTYERVGTVNDELSLADVEVILKSLVKVEDFDFKEDISNDDIFIQNMEDMKYASEQLGFQIKVPRDNPILGTFGSGRLYRETEDGHNSVSLWIGYDGTKLSFCQTTTGGYYYDQFEATGRFDMKESEKFWYSDMTGEWITVDGQKVLKILETRHLLKEQDKADYFNRYIIKVDDNHFFKMNFGRNSNAQNDIKIIKELLKTEYEVFE